MFEVQMFNRLDVIESRNEDTKRNFVHSFTLFATNGDGTDTEAWCFPLQAVADRKEVYGLSSNEGSLEFLGQARLHPEAEGEACAMVYPAYAAHVSEEFKASQSRPFAARSVNARTVMGLDSALNDQSNTDLDRARERALEHVMGGPSGAGAASFGRRSLSAMECTEDVLERVLSLCERDQDVIEAWRLETVISFVPQLQDTMQASTGVYESARQAGLRGPVSA